MARVTLFKGSSNLATSMMPSHMASNLPLVERSSRLMRDEERLLSTAFCMSFLLAARMLSLECSRASLMLCRASDRCLSESVFSTVDAK